jgi:DNA-binding MarR family transcriptional regulator
MSRRLADQGFDDYRVSDALAVRLLTHGALPLAEFTSVLDVSRQAARKVVDGLVERGYARVRTDATDRRRRSVQLTPRGRVFAAAVIDAIHDLNDELVEKVDPVHLEGARTVLGFVKDNFGS